MSADIYTLKRKPAFADTAPRAGPGEALIEALLGDRGEWTEVRLTEVLAQIESLLRQWNQSVGTMTAWRIAAAHHFDQLSEREREVMALVLAGHASKLIAFELGISQRTVENHRAMIMRKSGAKSLPELARLALAASWPEGSGQV